MRFVGADEIRSLLTFQILVAALEAAHRRPKIEVQGLKKIWSGLES
jgi:hypothetical protein